MATPLLLLALLAAPSATEAPPAVSRLIEQLGSAEFAEREAATRGLEAVGPAALPALRQAAAADDPEVRRRADELVRSLEAEALARKVLAPTRVRLVYHNKPLREAVEDLNRKTGTQFVLQDPSGPAAQRPLTLDTGDVTIWEAVEQFCRKAGVSEFVSGEPAQAGLPRLPAGVRVPGGRAAGAQAQIQLQMQVQAQLQMQMAANGMRPAYTVQAGPVPLVEGKAPSLPTCLAGAVRVRALPPDGPAAVAPRHAGEVVVVLEATAEPHLVWHGVEGAHIDRALDDRGQRLAQAWEPVTPTPSPMPPGFARARLRQLAVAGTVPTAGTQQVPVFLKKGEQPSKVLKELSGVLQADVMTPPEPVLAIDNLLQSAGKTVRRPEGGSLTLSQVEKTDSGMVLFNCELELPPDVLPGTLNARHPAGADRGPGHGARAGVEARLNGLHLLDAHGSPLPIFPTSVQPRPRAGTIVWEYGFACSSTNGPAEAVRLVFVGSRTTTITIPFRLTDVPLP